MLGGLCTDAYSLFLCSGSRRFPRSGELEMMSYSPHP